ncbi:MAG TPA: hypothetical protein VD902_11435 [Symbiobacteriaceae bacterium]|nr:hypothetical protein [Symbiobacteriaceae bacterium]
MADYDQNLNRDAAKVRTSARWISALGRWLHDVALYVLNGAGEPVQVGPDNPMPVKLSGSNVQQTPGSAVAGKDVLLLGGNDGTNAQGLKVDAQKNLLVGLRNSSGAEPYIGANPLSGDSTGAPAATLAAAVYQLGFNGLNWDRVRVPNVFKQVGIAGIASGGASTIWAPTAGKKLRLMGALLSCNNLGNLQLRMGLAGAGTIRVNVALAANTALHVSFGQGISASAINDVLELYNNTGTTNSYYITVWGTEE